MFPGHVGSRLGLDRRAADDRKFLHPDWPAGSVSRFVVSFPKAGRTWLRMMLAAALAGREHEGPTLRRLKPHLSDHGVTFNDDIVFFTHALSNRVRLTGGTMELFARYLQPARRVFVIRDPRDTVVSYYFQCTRRLAPPPGRSVPDNLSDFVRDPEFGVPRIIEFLNLWTRLVATGGPAAAVSYEYLHENPVDALTRVLAVLDLGSFSERSIEQAVAFSSFDHMRRLEASDALGFLKNKVLSTPDPHDPESFKTRQGVVGGHERYLSSEDLAFIEERIAHDLEAAVGYRQPGVPAIEGVRVFNG